MLDGVMLGCAVGALLGDSVVGAMLDGVMLGCAVGALLGDFLVVVWERCWMALRWAAQSIHLCMYVCGLI